jgi:hypothetical protein
MASLRDVLVSFEVYTRQSQHVPNAQVRKALQDFPKEAAKIIAARIAYVEVRC